MAELNARIPCEDETRDRLRELKEGSETYDNVLTWLMDEYEQKGKDGV